MASDIAVTGIRLSAELKARAQVVAKQRGVSLSGLVGFVLAEYVDDHPPYVQERVSKVLKARAAGVPLPGPSRQQRRAQERATAKEQR